MTLSISFIAIYVGRGHLTASHLMCSSTLLSCHRLMSSIYVFLFVHSLFGWYLLHTRIPDQLHFMGDSMNRFKMKTNLRKNQNEYFSFAPYPMVIKLLLWCDILQPRAKAHPTSCFGSFGGTTAFTVHTHANSL